MKALFNLLRAVAALIFLLVVVPSRSCPAQHWQDLGNEPNSLDKIYIDADSIEQQDGLRIALIKIVLPQPEINKNNITSDSRIQRNAFDCDRKLFYIIQMFGYLNGHQVGNSPAATDWKTRLLPVGNDPLSQRVLSAACSLPAKTGPAAPAGASPTPPSPTQPGSHEAALNAENLLFVPPKNFKVGFNSDRPGFTMREFVPNTETVEDWTEMLTVQVFRNSATPPAFLENIAGQWLKTCPESVKPTIFNGHVNGYDVSMMVLKCAKIPVSGKPENTLFRAIRGKDALYVVQQAWRTAAPSDEGRSALTKSTVCDTRDPTHPCPSFDSLVTPATPKPTFNTGSGIIVNDQGYILTNAHVVNSCKSVAVKPQNGSPVPATLEAIDTRNDLALIKTTPGYGHPAQFRSDSTPARLGETIGVIGYPLMGILSAGPKATFGQINSVAGAGNDSTLLQISAPVQPGNSGGPVLDTSGNVIAVVVSEASAAMAAKIGVVPQNINFAIRGEVAQIFMHAHGVKFKVGDRKKELRTDEIADEGQKSTAFVICSHQ